MEVKKVAIIPSAGKNSRMKSSLLPKSLRTLLTKTILDYLIETINEYIDVIIIPISSLDYKSKVFENMILKKNQKKVIFIPTILGAGDGNAILDGLRYVNSNISSEKHIMICWSDIFIYNKKIINFCYNNLTKNNDSIIFLPTKKVNKPYVGIFRDYNKNIKKVLFSKEGTKIANMEQDHCIFFINYRVMFKELNLYKKSLKSREFIFLKIINWLYKKNYKIIGLEYKDKRFKYDPVLSFNTDKQLSIIKSIIN